MSKMSMQNFAVFGKSKKELHGIDAFGGLYMEKDSHNIEMRRENIREKMRKGKMALEICVCGKEAA